ncbi:MAG TPA: histidine kinase dimerization/phospho-acceptor domain-containing protein [Planctomycetota bacterium]|nr:histidine kinase dimerization/phospho-acceptor domain-containing protein [Planctomycetota bacterium]
MTNENVSASVDAGGESRHERLRRLAHDLRNSLFVVRSGIQILRETRGDTESEILDLMEREHRRAADLVEELVTTARAD